MDGTRACPVAQPGRGARRGREPGASPVRIGTRGCGTAHTVGSAPLLRSRASVTRRLAGLIAADTIHAVPRRALTVDGTSSAGGELVEDLGVHHGGIGPCPSATD